MSRSFKTLCMERRARYGDGFDNSQLNGRFAEDYDKGPNHNTGIVFGSGRIGNGYLDVSEGPVPHFIIKSNPASPTGAVVDIMARPL